MDHLKKMLAIGFRFQPYSEDLITYYLPRLVAGEQPQDTAECINRADVYGGEPRELAGRFPPLHKSVNGDRFFFSTCKRQKDGSRRRARVAGRGVWTSQTSREIKNGAGVKIGETKVFRFKNGGKYTDWLMEEHHSCLQQAVAGDEEPVICKIYVSPRVPQESRFPRASGILRRPRGHVNLADDGFLVAGDGLLQVAVVLLHQPVGVLPAILEAEHLGLADLDPGAVLDLPARLRGPDATSRHPRPPPAAVLLPLARAEKEPVAVHALVQRREPAGELPGLAAVDIRAVDALRGVLRLLAGDQPWQKSYVIQTLLCLWKVLHVDLSILSVDELPRPPWPASPYSTCASGSRFSSAAVSSIGGSQRAGPPSQSPPPPETWTGGPG
ncbi:hypothetical protein ABZP36_012657 [Zizania latifolia]